MAMCYPDSTDWSCVGTPEEIAELDPAVKARSEFLAWGSIARLSGFRVSTCPVVLRPCRVRCAPDGLLTATVSTWGDGVGFSPYIEGGKWFNACGCRRDSCGCGIIRELILPDQEVSGPITVTIDGATLDPSSYRIDNGNRLVRQDGQDWPMCQDMNKPLAAPVAYEPLTLTWPDGSTVTLTRVGDVVTAVSNITPGNLPIEILDLPVGFRPAGTGQFLITPHTNYAIVLRDEWQGSASTIGFAALGAAPFLPGTAQWLAEPAPVVGQEGTFAISYYVGVGPDDVLNYAAGLLAGEWYKACTGRECRLPDTATKVVRQGVSFEIPSFDQGTSGMREVDNIIAMYNPHHLKTPSRVLSFDSIRGRKRTA